MKNHEESKPSQGEIKQIIGVVVDVHFSGTLPALYNALQAKLPSGETITLEVQQHLGAGTVRAVSMSTTDGLARGGAVTDTGAPISVPVGPATLGRMFNVTGEEIDGKGNDYLRSVLILNKYNPLGCLIIPLSSVREIDKDNILIGVILDKTATANMSQIKSISSMRLVEKMVVIKKLNFINIQKAVMKYNFPLQLFDIPSPSIEESSPKADIN